MEKTDQKTIARQVYDYLERLNHLIQADERQLGKEYGLQPIQLEALYYLSCCNKYSNHLNGVRAYLRLTKGTVSQTLRLLENKGFVKKVTDPNDRRVVHFLLTQEGINVLKHFPPDILKNSIQEMPLEMGQTIVGQLHGLLKSIQQTNNLKSFGVCQTCRHFLTNSPGVYQCGLTQEPLDSTEIQQICHEHTHR